MYQFQGSPQPLLKRPTSFTGSFAKPTPEPTPTPAETPEPTPEAAPDPIDYLLKHPEALPKEVTLLVSTQFALMVDGVAEGNIEGRPGTTLSVVGIEPGYLSVALGSASNQIPIESTDLAKRATQAVEIHRNRVALQEGLDATRSTPSSPIATENVAQGVFPASDPANSGKWKLNEKVSDEFEAGKLDPEKWLIQGADGGYKSQWIGCAPSQFSTENVRVENGKLMIETRWEPDFKFSEKPDKDGTKYENITTAAVISRTPFHYGYMEIKCKAANASITSSFWMTGKDFELDVFEFNGAPTGENEQKLETEMLTTIIDWVTGSSVHLWRDGYDLGWKVAKDFHVYGCEWNAYYLKFYADGKLVGSITREELGEKWILKHPGNIGVDSKTLPWQGLPSKTDLPADYEIEYIRVWQQP